MKVSRLLKSVVEFQSHLRNLQPDTGLTEEQIVAMTPKRFPRFMVSTYTNGKWSHRIMPAPNSYIISLAKKPPTKI